MHGSSKHSTIKGLLIKFKAWSVACLHGHPYKVRHHLHGRPDEYKNIDRASIRRP